MVYPFYKLKLFSHNYFHLHKLIPVYQAILFRVMGVPFPLALRSLIRNFAKIYKWEKKWRKKTIGYCLTK